MKKGLVLFLGLLIVSTYGCHKEISDKNTQTLDSAIAVIESAKKVINTLDSAEITRLDKIYSAYYAFFSDEFTDMSNPDFYTSTLADMAECYKRINRTQMGLPAWREELEKAEKQLKTLRHDYANQLLDSTEFQKYFLAELRSAAEINNEVTKNAGMVSKCMRNHKEMNAKLDSARTAFLATEE